MERFRNCLEFNALVIEKFLEAYQKIFHLRYNFHLNICLRLGINVFFKSSSCMSSRKIVWVMLETSERERIKICSQKAPHLWLRCNVFMRMNYCNESRQIMTLTRIVHAWSTSPNSSKNKIMQGSRFCLFLEIFEH